MIIYADETIGMVKRYIHGFEIDSEHLALDVINQVGPGGNFPLERHTLDHFQKEHWPPIARSPWRQALRTNWIESGKRLEPNHGNN